MSFEKGWFFISSPSSLEGCLVVDQNLVQQVVESRGNAPRGGRDLSRGVGGAILYGCGDFLNDYEGISGREEYRGELVLMYFVTLDSSSRELTRLEMTPLEIRRLRLNRVSGRDAGWIQGVLDREAGKLGARVELGRDRTLILRF